MKKILAVCLAITSVLVFANNTKAQVKIGLFDRETVLGLMPGIQKVDSLIQKYVQDSLKTEYDYELDEFKRIDSMYKKDSATMNPSKKQIVQKELSQHFYKIQNWQQYQNQMVQQKQSELLKPYLEKIGEAFQAVVTEQKYTHVFKPDVFEYFEPEKANEFTLRVLAKLKIPLPKEIEDQVKALTGGAATKPAAKPATKAGGKN
ncbi:MAG: OmpH family outer membrane protein [Bacteroidota bacterium]|nr:OmpH family outer membrane protein [Bacteroidota bacterium]